MENTILVKSLGVVANFAAVLVALFKDEFLRCRRKPNLLVSIDSSSSDCCHKTNWSNGTDCYFLRFKVENSGKSRAEAVEVVIAELHRKNVDGSFKKMESFPSSNLRWANDHKTYEDISPGMWKYCDLGHVNDPTPEDLNPADRVEGEDTEFELDLCWKPNTRTHFLQPGTYRFSFAYCGSELCSC